MYVFVVAILVAAGALGLLAWLMQSGKKAHFVAEHGMFEWLAICVRLLAE